MTFKAVLFDCDGVLVDSEAITCGVLRDMFQELGWHMSLQECMDQFVGHTVRTRKDLIEARTGQPFTDAWLQSFYQRRNVQLQAHARAIPNIVQAVAHLHQAFDGQIACASGADRHKIELMLDKVGLLPYFDGRIFSGHETPRSKPAPDVYLAAAAHLGVDPAHCLVIEDTHIGVTAGVAAGATVWGYAVHGQDEALRQSGAVRIFNEMRDLLQVGPTGVRCETLPG
jgi:HAD superfamily hydrolase (TIGR01509 family)